MLSPGKLIRRVLRVLLGTAVSLVAATVLLVVSLRWLDPPTTSFMAQRQVAVALDGQERPWIHHRWVPWSRIPPTVPLAVVAAEDQRFPEHAGFDLDAIRKAIQERESRGRVRGASTISQQVAKNLFLWPGRSWVRKGLEVYFTALIEITWPKRRVLEVYVNVAQFGDRVFGVGAAADELLRKPVAALNEADAALLAAVLPNPRRLRLVSPSRYVQGRVAWIREQMAQLGPDYLSGV